MGDETAYDIYKDMMTTYNDASTTDSDTDYGDLDDIKLYKNYGMDANLMILNMTRFSKQSKIINDLGGVRETELGRCWQINDRSDLVQWVAGPTGGLELVLDARTADYIETTESSGFSVTLHMPNETVLNKEFAFYVGVGQHAEVNLKYTGYTTRPPSRHLL